MEELIGRELLAEEWNFIEEIANQAEKYAGFTESEGITLCNRCGTAQIKQTPSPCSCGKDCFYCVHCLQMGKIKKCSILYHLSESNQFSLLEEPILTWNGKLSKQQQYASNTIKNAVDTNETRLIWAVTGAGKTEMLFQGIAHALKQKKRVCIASPRVDVCLELAPRLQAAFAGVPIAVLHGSMEEPYQYTQLVIATTHQLMRFKEAFDFLIIDEVDAFPFYIDAGLQFASNKARKKKSALIYLSATPNQKMQLAISKKQLAVTVLPARYHGYPLPVPMLKWVGDWKGAIKKENKGLVYKQIRRLVAKKKRFLVFVPHIPYMLQLEGCMKKWFPELQFESVFAADEQRREKVQAMRNETLDCLLTTTILERGVTFRDIDVLVLGSEDETYTEAALVQIAGRAGRNKEHPFGEVVYLYYGKTKEMVRAKKQIVKMNKQAVHQGLLI
ncbi:MAG: DEAD/DEAH box helicase family protein [Pisciglobus halotolerans]|nr:DEAD/DEAH box helicase family protein [Pisciglobus halotolerans]